MKPSRAHVLLFCVLAVLLVPAVRLAWVASHTETGWETIRLGWHAAALGLLGMQRVPVGNLEPTDQADFWLAETERILAADPENAEIAMGAAWVLDLPGTGRNGSQDRCVSRTLRVATWLR